MTINGFILGKNFPRGTLPKIQLKFFVTDFSIIQCISNGAMLQVLEFFKLYRFEIFSQYIFSLSGIFLETMQGRSKLCGRDLL